MQAYLPRFLPELQLLKSGVTPQCAFPLQERMDGIESQRRNRSVEETLQIWEEMQKGSSEGLKNCMRWKISMTNPNKAMRDPVAYRCNLTPHHRTGTKYKVGRRLHRGTTWTLGGEAIVKAPLALNLLGMKGR